ncbi:MAG: hypothetical protein ACPG77_19640, partial [Nannocystaceae bacterium]
RICCTHFLVTSGGRSRERAIFSISSAFVIVDPTPHCDCNQRNGPTTLWIGGSSVNRITGASANSRITIFSRPTRFNEED